MADSSDVSNALVAAVDAVRVSLGATWSIYRGYPEADALDNELAHGDVHVTVNERDGFTRLTTRYPDVAVEMPRVPVTLTVSVVGNVATFAGTCSTDQIAGVQAGSMAWVTRCVANDTPAAVAARLAAASSGSVAGAAVTLAGLVTARTGRDGATVRPTRQQEVGYSICIWCADPATRDAVGSAIDAALSDVTFLTLADASGSRLTWMGGRTTDRAENSNLYKRELYYRAEYTTTIAGSATPALFPGVVLDGNGARQGLGAFPPVVRVRVDGSGNPIVDVAGNLIGEYA